jgi:type IV pilus assembly protein PilB
VEFATGLRALLRQDPDIIMVGEIRDRQTAEIAVRAALVGRLMLSTLHTNDATGAVPRLLDMGIEPFLVASSVNLVVAQRLVRKVCAACRRPVELDAEVLRELQLDPAEAQGATFAEGAGCVDCNSTGYRGRRGIYEVMVMSPRLRGLTLDRASAGEVKKAAIAESMLTLRRDGLEKLKRGITTAEEILKESAPDDL